MNTLEKFKAIHQDKDIYIIASGYSCEFIDPEFFKNKITIGINQVHKKFTIRYGVRKEQKNLDTILSESPGTLWFVSLHDCGVYHFPKLDIKKYEANPNICIFKHNNNDDPRQPIMKLPDNGLLASHSTITSGIHLAAYMGAKNIILVGHDCGTLDNQCNFTGYHTKESLYLWKNGESDYKKWLPEIEGQTIQLKKILKEIYNCNVYSLNPFINFGLEGHIYKKG
jgi:hypothetical protein